MGKYSGVTLTLSRRAPPFQTEFNIIVNFKYIKLPYIYISNSNNTQELKTQL